MISSNRELGTRDGKGSSSVLSLHVLMRLPVRIEPLEGELNPKALIQIDDAAREKFVRLYLFQLLRRSAPARAILRPCKPAARGSSHSPEMQRLANMQSENQRPVRHQP